MFETLADLANVGAISIRTGPFGSALHAHEYQASGIPVIPTEAIAEGRIQRQKLIFITTKKAKTLEKYTLRSGDIVFARRGAQACGLSAIVETDYENSILGTGIIAVRIHDNAMIDPKYLAYFAGAPQSIAWLKHHAIGATMPNLNSSIILSLPVNIPDKVTQLSIVKILSSLDRKIELNRQINATLESMAQALFKSWFVDFDPVIDNALAAGNSIPEQLQVRANARAALGDQRKPLPEALRKQFPDRFVLTEEMGWVPEGWIPSLFGSLIESTIGGDWGKDGPDDKHSKYVAIIRGTDIPSIKVGSNGSAPLRWIEQKKFISRELKDGDLVIEISGGSPTQPTGRAVYITEQNLKLLGGSAVAASFCRRMRPKTSTLGLYAALHLDRIYTEGKMWGYQSQSTGISNFQTQHFLESELVMLPSAIDILNEFFNIVRPMIDRSRSHEGVHLARLRDTLLPKLLSGQIRIPDAEKQIAEAV